MILILALCLHFSVIENLCSLGRTSTGAERIWHSWAPARRTDTECEGLSTRRTASAVL